MGIALGGTARGFRGTASYTVGAKTRVTGTPLRRRDAHSDSLTQNYAILEFVNEELSFRILSVWVTLERTLEPSPNSWHSMVGSRIG